MVTVALGVRVTFVAFEYAPPPPPPPLPLCALAAVFPPPPPPMTSILLFALFQSAGTTQVVPEVR
jgi:hypothetical protein